MPIFRVVRKADNTTVYAYSSDAPVEFAEYSFAEYRHIEEIVVREDRSIAADSTRVVTKLAYLRRFTSAERIAINAAAKASAQLEDYLKLLDVAQEIDLDDPDTIAAAQMLEQSGLIAAGRAAEILA